MSAPLGPSLFDQLVRTRFSFYPAIANVDPNEWLLTNVSWSDVKVVNTRTNMALWIPRQYIGAVSEIDDPVLIVGLTKELEYAENAVRPRVRRVIEMPMAVNDHVAFSRARPHMGPAPVVGIRLENEVESRTGRILFFAGVGAVVVSLFAAEFGSDWISSWRASWRSNQHVNPSPVNASSAHSH